MAILNQKENTNLLSKTPNSKVFQYNSSNDPSNTELLKNESSLVINDDVDKSGIYEDIDIEDKNPLTPFEKQCYEIWQTVQLKAVWRPMVTNITMYLLLSD